MQSLVDMHGAFRRGNEAIAAAARRAGVDDAFKIDFICECADPDCLARVPLDLSTYESIRGNGGRVTLPNHQTAA
jgi:hypothetical protein